MASQKHQKRKMTERTIALCYIRQSRTIDENDTNSPTRQRSNIQAVCDRYGWTPEWYEDVGGHKSGRSEKGRTQWLALKARLADPDVVALVANDLSRLHRKGWRIGDLIEFLNENSVNLVLAAPGREVDTTTTKGRMFLQFGAIIDEYYAEDISQRAKDSVEYRKRRGISIGMPPFGTTRNEHGYLIASNEGAWLLPDGKFIKGDGGSQLPFDGAVWRSYYQSAERILILYAQGDIGNEKIAYTLNEEGYAYRDRTGEPRNVWRDDIRRVVANWAEYGGIVLPEKAKDRKAYEEYNMDEVPFLEERAIFPIELLRKVGQVRQERSVRPPDRSKKIRSYPYPLSAVSYCAKCEEIAQESNKPKLRSPLSGNTYIDGSQRYKHKTGIQCGCKNRSVRREIFEHDFNRLIGLLSVKPQALDLMTEIAIQVDKTRGAYRDESDLEAQKTAAIALCRRRIDAATHLYSDGVIERTEYLRRVESNEREMAHWQARSSETEKLALELSMCLEAVEKIQRLWETTEDEDRQGLVRSLFTEIIYDLDTQRIVDFRLKPWADRFLVLRAALYEDELQKENSPSIEGLRNEVPHTGFEPVF